jgi:hypothetical protein
MNQMFRKHARRLGSDARRRSPARGPELPDIQNCLADVEAALRRVERAVSRLKAEAVLRRFERALSDASLAPNAEPIRESEPFGPWPVVLGRQVYSKSDFAA